ncbi:hypothetical protein VULLAG_LOCUS15572 [Vulpes lagopus]
MQQTMSLDAEGVTCPELHSGSLSMMRKLRHCPRSKSFTGDEVMTVSSKGMRPQNAAEKTSVERRPVLRQDTLNHCTKKGFVQGMLFLSSLPLVLIIHHS